MHKSKIEYKRMRPLMGTFVSVHLKLRETSDRESADALVTAVFSLGQRLENLFSKNRADSELNLVNASPTGLAHASAEFCELLSKSLKLWEVSAGAFNPFFPGICPPVPAPFIFIDETSFFKSTDLKLDLAGVAKGFIVDKMVYFLEENLPGIPGVVNAGGDLRFFNNAENELHLRTGPAHFPVLRPLIADWPAVATSRPRQSLETFSSSVYDQSAFAKSEDTFVGFAKESWLADGLTKVAISADPDVTALCAQIMDGATLIFSAETPPL